MVNCPFLNEFKPDDPSKNERCYLDMFLGSRFAAALAPCTSSGVPGAVQGQKKDGAGCCRSFPRLRSVIVENKPKGASEKLSHASLLGRPLPPDPFFLLQESNLAAVAATGRAPLVTRWALDQLASAVAGGLIHILAKVVEFTLKSYCYHRSAVHFLLVTEVDRLLLWRWADLGLVSIIKGPTFIGSSQACLLQKSAGTLELWLSTLVALKVIVEPIASFKSQTSRQLSS